MKMPKRFVQVVLLGNINHLLDKLVVLLHLLVSMLQLMLLHLQVNVHLLVLQLNMNQQLVRQLRIVVVLRVLLS